MMFKAQHPSNLISRLFILEYMRELDNEEMYNKANKYQKKKYFYKYISENSEGSQEVEGIDLNWEYCLFEATLYELEAFMKNFFDEIAAIDSRRNKDLEKQLLEAKANIESQPVDINIMDLAATEIKNSSNGKIIT